MVCCSLSLDLILSLSLVLPRKIFWPSLELKLACSRIDVVLAKQTALVQQRRRAVAELLMKDPTKNYLNARQQAATLYREENALDAYPLVQLQCQHLASRNLSSNVSPKYCPPDLIQPLSTLLWVASTTTLAGDVRELATVRSLLTPLCGRSFCTAALANANGCVEERIFRRLSLDRPLDQASIGMLDVYMEDICRQHHVEWQPPPPEEQEAADALLFPAVTGHERGGEYGDLEARDDVAQEEKSKALPFNLRLEWVSSVLRGN